MALRICEIRYAFLRTYVQVMGDLHLPMNSDFSRVSHADKRIMKKAIILTLVLVVLAPRAPSQTSATLSGHIYVDGVKYSTIEDALAAVPVGGGEVDVPTNITSWAGGKLPDHAVLRFIGGNRTVVLGGQIIAGKGSQIWCQSALAMSHVPPLFGTVLDFSRAGLTSSQDAIMASFPVSSVEIHGCIIKMGNTGRRGISLSAVSDTKLDAVTVMDPGASCFYFDSGIMGNGDHSYWNLNERLTCIHPGMNASHIELRTDAGGLGDIDHFTCLSCKFSSSDPGSTTVVNEGVILLAAGPLVSNGIADVHFLNAYTTGGKPGGYSIKLTKAKGSAQFAGLIFTGEYEDLYNPGTGTLFLMSGLTKGDLKGLHFEATSAGYDTWTSPPITEALAPGYYFNPDLTNVQPEFGAVQWRSPSAGISACGTLTNSGPAFCSSHGGNYQWFISDEGIVHYYRTDRGADQWQINPNLWIGPSTNNTWGSGNPGHSWAHTDSFIFRTGAPDPSGSGLVRLANNEKIGWRNAANTTDDVIGEIQTQSASGCRTAPVAGSACSVTITWPSAFADTNYRAECGGRLVTSGVPLNGGLTAFTAASVTFQTVAGTDVAAQYTNIDCVGVHN